MAINIPIAPNESGFEVLGASGYYHYFNKALGFETEQSVADYFATNGKFVQRTSKKGTIYFVPLTVITNLPVEQLAEKQIVEEELITLGEY